MEQREKFDTIGPFFFLQGLIGKVDKDSYLSRKREALGCEQLKLVAWTCYSVISNFLLLIHKVLCPAVRVLPLFWLKTWTLECLAPIWKGNH